MRFKKFFDNFISNKLFNNIVKPHDKQKISIHSIDENGKFSEHAFYSNNKEEIDNNSKNPGYY